MYRTSILFVRLSKVMGQTMYDVVYFRNDNKSILAICNVSIFRFTIPIFWQFLQCVSVSVSV